MTDNKKDKGFDEYLSGSSPLSDAYQALDKPEPPPDLDRAILAEARKSARGRAWIPRARWNTWLLAGTIAATIALSMTLVLEVTAVDPIFRQLSAPESETVTSAPDLVLDTPDKDDLEERAEENSRLDYLAQDHELKNEAAKRLPAIDVPAQARPSAAPAEQLIKAARLERDAARVVEATGDADYSGEEADPALASGRVNGRTESLPERGSAGALSDGLSVTVEPRGREQAPHTAGTHKQRSFQSTDTGLGLSSLAAAQKSNLSRWPEPDVWLAGIRYLQERGETERAAIELAKFRNVYPNYEIPAVPIETE